MTGLARTKDRRGLGLLGDGEGAGRGPRPRRLGPYRLGERLGRGRFSEVVRGDPDAGPPRALKVLTAPGLVGALRREAEALVALAHPHVMGLRGADLAADPPYLVLELLEPGPLPALRPLPPRQVLALARQLLSALAHAHRRGLAHLGLEPRAILSGPSGLKLSRFWAARCLARRGDAAGAPDYLAPEQRDGAGGDRCSDVYSFGVLVGQALSGRAPSPGADPRAGLARCPPWAAALVERCCCPRAHRLRDADEALRLLADLTGESPT